MKAFPGDLMIITDHINNMGTNPLIGPNDASLVPGSLICRKHIRKNYEMLAKEIARRLNIRCKRRCLCWKYGSSL